MSTLHWVNDYLKHINIFQTYFIKVGKLLLLIIKPLFRLISVTCPQGALTSIYCATSDDIPCNNGAYYE